MALNISDMMMGCIGVTWWVFVRSGEVVAKPDSKPVERLRGSVNGSEGR